MKTLFKFILVLLIPLNLFGQNTKSKNNELSFFDQKEFRKEYKKYSKLEIKIFENSVLINDSIIVNFHKELDSKYKTIIENGFLTPETINNVNNLRLTNFADLPGLENNFRIKRFRFWIFYPNTNNPLTNTINPDEYYFELKNENANEGTNYEDFIKGAKMTFIKFKTLII